MENKYFNQEYMDYLKEIVRQKHDGQLRKQGTPYYLHPYAVAEILKQKGFNEDYQVVGLLHDLIEDTDATYDYVVSISNKDIANAVKILSKEKGYIMQKYITDINGNKKAKMVKLADRIHNLSEAKNTSIEFIEKYIKETENWYIDLAKDTVFEEDLKKCLNELKKDIYN